MTTILRLSLQATEPEEMKPCPATSPAFQTGWPHLESSHLGFPREVLCSYRVLTSTSFQRSFSSVLGKIWFQSKHLYTKLEAESKGWERMEKGKREESWGREKLTGVSEEDGKREGRESFPFPPSKLSPPRPP